MADEQLLRCVDCRAAMRRIEEVQHPVVKCRWLEFYECSNGHKAVLQWERPDGEFTKEDQSFVEREVMNRGHFFPSDYT